MKRKFSGAVSQEAKKGVIFQTTMICQNKTSRRRSEKAGGARRRGADSEAERKVKNMGVYIPAPVVPPPRSEFKIVGL